ncbi:MAG: osmoprotectant ABC transporter substrate-binding protein [Erysipelothrix sp.]|nr:osmoprotectant ABC transporter substrate-binding protein [Erysipelothrix sp.]
MKKYLITLILLISLSACTLPGLSGSSKNNDIVIASGGITERQIVSEIVAQMIRHYMPDTRVDILSNLGSSVLINQAMISGDANISSVMYTGTSLTGELGLEATTNVEEAFWTVVNGFSEQYDRVWFPSVGFTNTYAFMVSRSFAEEHNLNTISDMKDIAEDLRTGIDSAWLQREGDGYTDFKIKYDYEFGTVTPMEISLVYSAVLAGTMDVVLGYSTDGRIDAYDLVVLEDDLNFFPPYDASPVTSMKILKAYPELEDVLLRLENKISSEIMQKLNRKSDEDKIEPNIVAREFLEENNFFEDASIIKLKDRKGYEKVLENMEALDKND